MMMQSELLPPTCPSFNFTCSTLNQDTEFCDFAYSFRESSVFSSNSYIPDFDLEILDDVMQIMSCEWINGDGHEESPSSQLTMEEDEWTETSLQLQGDDQLTLLHLLRAYGEAMENGENELAEVIVKSINDKSSPLGTTVQRVAYNLFQSTEYIREESLNNLVPAAFKVLYNSLPNGRIAHFTANSAILEAMPNDAATVHIVDFNVGEGIQWPPLIEALNKKKEIRLTSIRFEGEPTSSFWNFEDTKKRLLAHAKQYGVKLQIEEKCIEDFGGDLRMKNRGEWVVFNCMVGLPHMGMRRRRSRKSVQEFLKVAKEMIPDYRGIVILGDGEAKESLNNYAAYFDSLLRHYQAIFEALEGNFPAYLVEARTAMESLFLAPLMSSVAWLQDWKETGKSCDEIGLNGRKVSVDSLDEAKQMISGESCYSVKIEGNEVHEMVLRWRETPLVRVSTWIM